MSLTRPLLYLQVVLFLSGPVLGQMPQNEPAADRTAAPGERDWVGGLALDAAVRREPTDTPANNIPAEVLALLGAHLDDLRYSPLLWSCMEAQAEAMSQGLHYGLDPSADLTRLKASVNECTEARESWLLSLEALGDLSSDCRPGDGIALFGDLARCLEASGSAALSRTLAIRRAAIRRYRAAGAARARTLETAWRLLSQAFGDKRMESSALAERLLWRLLASPDGYWASICPQIRSYQALVEAHRAYASYLATPWKTLDKAALKLRPRRSHRLVSALWDRLRLEGYLAPASKPSMRKDKPWFDNGLRTALKRFQEDHLLRARGTMNRATLRKLNVTAEEKLARIRLALRAWSLALGPHQARRDLILVQIPAAIAVVYLRGDLWRTLRVVVGSTRKRWNPKTRRKDYAFRTPELASRIDRVVLNPEWIVPDSIKEKELDPKLFDEPDFYEKHNYRFRRFSGGREVLIQKPGPGNALGRVKFLFRNPHGVYLHDTPSKRLFRKTRRLYSHGCIRVERALDLAAAILMRDRDIDWTFIRRALRKDKPTTIKLHQEIPIRVVYATVDAWPGRKPRFIPDWYNQQTKELMDGEILRVRSLLRPPAEPQRPPHE